MKITKKWLMIASFLILAGSLIFVGVMTVLGWDFLKLSSVKYVSNKYEFSEDFGKISVITDTADVTFAPSYNGKCVVECVERENERHTVAVTSDGLTISISDQTPWYKNIGIDFRTTKIKVYLPKTEYGALLVEASTGDVEVPKDFRFEKLDITLSTGDVDVSAFASAKMQIRTSTGDIKVEDASVGALDLMVTTGEVAVSNVICENDTNITVSTGKSELSNLFCKNLTTTGNTGNITLTNVVASGKLSVTRTTGKVKFEKSDAPEIYVETDTGDVTGSLLSDKVYIVHTDTGKVDVPNTTVGGRCEIRTDTGDIKIRIQ